MNSKIITLFFMQILTGISILLGNNSQVETIFTTIYDQGVWATNDQGEGTSGLGSIAKNVHPYMAFLQNFLDQNEIKSVVDVGCGDWQLSKQINWHNALYIGIDTVKKVVEKNQILFGNPLTVFIHGNALEMDLPPADLLICKDVLQHLSNQQIQEFILQFSKFKYCLITNDVDMDTLSSSNAEINTGWWHTLDLTKPPFNVNGRKVLTFPVPFENPITVKQILYIKN